MRCLIRWMQLDGTPHNGIVPIERVPDRRMRILVIIIKLPDYSLTIGLSEALYYIAAQRGTHST